MEAFLDSMTTHPCRIRLRRDRVIDDLGRVHRENFDRQAIEEATQMAGPEERENNKLAKQVRIVLQRDEELDSKACKDQARKDQAWRKRVQERQRLLMAPINPALKDKRMRESIFFLASGRLSRRKGIDKKLDVLQQVYGSVESWADAKEKMREDENIKRKVWNKASKATASYCTLRMDGVPQQEFPPYLKDPIRYKFI